MRNHILSRLTALLLVLMLLPSLVCAELTETLTVGSKGDDVLRVKKRLYELGYYRSETFTRRYTEETAETVRTFQQLNGLPETGETDTQTALVLFSDQAVRAPHPTLTPLATPAPLTLPDFPPRDADGFLLSDEEYIYEQDEEGVWIYLSSTLQVMIRRHEDSKASLQWFETEIFTAGDEAFRTVATDPEHPGRSFRYPYVIAQDEQFVLGFSDDFYGNRMRNGEKVGIIIREGQVLSTETNRTNGHHLPNLDMMAQYPDGTLAVYPCNAYTADELLQMGAVNVFCFGPWLIRDGEINELVYKYYKSIEPRQALGMIAPNHYLLLSVQGRTSTSKGTTLQRMAEMMQAHGVTQALNLDGGNTMALVFRGRMLNKLATYKRKKFVRTVTSLIGIGHTEQIEP